MRINAMLIPTFLVAAAAAAGAAEVFTFETPVAPQQMARFVGPDRVVEVSSDGLVVVVSGPVDRLEDASAARAGSPFDTVPDWSNTLRRQVGGLAAADLDGDGDVDLAVGIYTSSSFPPYDDWHNLVYFNVGGALEDTPSWISADEVSTGEVTVALIDGDPYPDVFAANGGFAMSPSVVYFGSASGPSTTAGWSEAGATWTNYAAPFDVDGDGDVDVATANQGNSQFDPYRPVLLFVNDGGALQTSPGWQSAESSIQNFLSWGDLDGDGWADLAVSTWSGFESGVYDADDGTLATVPEWTTQDTAGDKGIAWADVDGDGWQDLALGHDPTQVWTSSAGSLAVGWSSTASYFGHSDLKWCDVEADGDPDLLEIHFSNGHANLYRNLDGTLETSPVWTYDSAGAGTAIECGDIDGNGFPDVIVGNSGDPSIHVFLDRMGVFADGFEAGSAGAWSQLVP